MSLDIRQDSLDGWSARSKEYRLLLRQILAINNV
jgi:hypothetical protein